MDPVLIGTLSVFVLIVLIIAGVPIGIAMVTVGLAGQVLLLGVPEAIAQLGFIVTQKGMNFLLTAIPLFILMGQLVYRTGLGSRLFEAAYLLVGSLPGGVSLATVVSSALFGSVTGSSIATVSSIGSLSLPEMRKYKYDLAFSSATIAASGTLSVLIPPSLFLIIYGSISGVSIADLFIASLIPAAILTAFFVVASLVLCTAKPRLGPPGPKSSAARKLASLFQVAPIALVFVVIVGGMSLGFFTATEAAAVGALSVMVIAALFRSLAPPAVLSALRESVSMSGSLFLIIVGGGMIGALFAQTEVTRLAADFIVAREFSALWFILFIVVLYIAFGTVLDALSMLVLLTPILLPIAITMGYDPVWFGIVVIVLAELAMITPPVGINVYVVGTLVPDVPIARIFRFTMPFVVLMLLLIALATAFPEIVLWLPRVVG